MTMPTPMHKILGEPPNQRPAHLRAFLAVLGREDSEAWMRVAECMAVKVAHVIREERSQGYRKDARADFLRIAEIARELNELTGGEDIIEAFRVLAPAPLRGPDDATGYEYLANLAERAEQAAEHIPKRAGARPLTAVLGRPSARRLCAAMVRAAFITVRGKPPGEQNKPAGKACGHLWSAAGGARMSNDAWARHLRDMRSKFEAATVHARLAAADCMRPLQQEAR